MNEQHMHFTSEMRELSLLHETDPSISSSRLEASLYEDYESLTLPRPFRHMLLHPFLAHL